MWFIYQINLSKYYISYIFLDLDLDVFIYLSFILIWNFKIIFLWEIHKKTWNQYADRKTHNEISTAF